MQALIVEFPRSGYVRDAHLQIAAIWEAAGERERSAEAYAVFAQRYSDDESGKDAWLKAADLFATAGLEARADTLRLAYIRRFPKDLETAMEILEPPARRELATVGPDRPVSKLLVTAGPKGKTVPAPTMLVAYLQRAQARPDLASRPLLAQLRFLEGEESHAAYAAERLRQPLATSIATKQKSLDRTLGLYRQAIDLGVAEWAHASTYRIGEALVAFGEAVERSERPADLQGDQLRAYEDVLLERSQPFYDRAEEVWSELLRQKARQSPEDPWIVKTQDRLWKRLADRFFYRAETEYPLVAGDAPPRLKAEKARAPKESRGGSGDTSARAQSEGGTP
jgi:hypothetical protein